MGTSQLDIVNVPYPYQLMTTDDVSRDLGMPMFCPVKNEPPLNPRNGDGLVAMHMCGVLEGCI